MKNIFILPLLIFALNNHAQVPKTVTTFTWSNEWVPYVRQTNTVDVSGSRINSKNEEWDAATSAWSPSSLYSYTNNAAGFEIQSTFQHWSVFSNSWVLRTVTQTTYNASNKIVTRLELDQDSVQSKRLDNYYYDSKGFPTSTESRVWDNGAWKLIRKGTFTNNSDGDPLIIQYKILVGGSLQNDIQIIYSYHSKGICSEYMYKRWLGSAWVEDGKTVFGFDIFGNVISHDVYDWVGGKWVMAGRYTSTNYPDGKTHFWVLESLNGSTWENSHKTSYEWFGSGPTGISEYVEDQLHPAIYFDFNGRQVEKQKGIILIEQNGNGRRKVIIQE